LRSKLATNTVIAPMLNEEHGFPTSRDAISDSFLAGWKAINRGRTKSCWMSRTITYLYRTKLGQFASGLLIKALITFFSVTMTFIFGLSDCLIRVFNPSITLDDFAVLAGNIPRRIARVFLIGSRERRCKP